MKLRKSVLAIIFTILSLIIIIILTGTNRNSKALNTEQIRKVLTTSEKLPSWWLQTPLSFIYTREVGVDKRNGIRIKRYIVCDDVCPAYSKAVVTYVNVNTEDDCKAVKGEPQYTTGWGIFAGCAPGLNNIPSYEAIRLVSALPQVKEFIDLWPDRYNVVNLIPNGPAWDSDEWKIRVAVFNNEINKLMTQGVYNVDKQTGKISQIE